MSDFGTFLVGQTPLCLGLPFYKDLLAAGLFYTLSERSELDFNGRNLFEQECPKSRICDIECRGRPIPMYPELKGIIEAYNPEVGQYQGVDVWLLKVDTCKSCPFKGECTKLCPAMIAFHERTRSREAYFLENSSSLTALTDEWLEKLYNEEEETQWTNRFSVNGDDIAWDCLTPAQKAAVFMVEVQGKTFEQAAKMRGVARNSIVTAHKSGMARLKEFGLARIALKTDRSCPFAIEYYENSSNIQGLTAHFRVSTGLVHKKLKEFRAKYSINS
jgi:hypothetical protein